MSATLTYEVFYPEDHEFIQNEFLPGFYHNGRVSYYLDMKIQVFRIQKMSSFIL